MGESQVNLTVEEVFDRIVSESVNTSDQGTAWERAVKFFFENDPAYADRFDGVWMWADAPTNPGKHDTGIDLVARERETGDYWAIQAKCFTSNAVSRADVDSFFAEAGMGSTYAYCVLADTAQRLTKNLDDYIREHDNVIRLGLDDIRRSNLPWQIFYASGFHLSCEEVRQERKRLIHEPRPHQRAAIDAVKAELAEADRTTLVMACGTGKTLTALRLAEEMVPSGTVLFLAPSISLVAQSMRDWAEQVRDKINPYVVCSDPKASNLGKGDPAEVAESYGTLSMVPYPATTNPGLLADHFKQDPGALNVVFSTYQSIDVIHEAQEAGLPAFDLVICDEAHRTTGRMHGEDGKADESAFVRVHDNQWIAAAKRLYMTATPRVYQTKQDDKQLPGVAARVSDGLVASMDDPEVYGRICHRLSFGAAVDQGLLTDYKIVVMRVDQSMMPVSVQRLVANSSGEIDMPDAARFIGVWKALFDRSHAGETSAGAMDLGEAAQTAASDDHRVLHHAIAFAANIAASDHLSKQFQNVVDAYLQGFEGPDKPDLGATAQSVRVEVQHVDGTMSSPERAAKLDWLAGNGGEDQCRVLSNARCLAEGIDVPSLDAVIYLSKRRSRVDIIQSVGRVMRTSPGKRYGYIVIPIFVAEGEDPSTALKSSREFGRIWDIVSALRSHDERLDAKINAASLGDDTPLDEIVEFDVLDPERLNRPKNVPMGAKHSIGEDAHDDEHDIVPAKKIKGGADDPGQAKFLLEDEEMAAAIRAQIVRKCGTKIYWNEWAGDVGRVTRARTEQIAKLVAGGGEAQDAFNGFLQGLRDTLNPDYGAERAIDVLAQHEVTKPIFDALFNQDQVRDHNPIVAGIDRALTALYDAGLPSSLESPELSDLYSQVRVIAKQVESDAAKQNLIKELYNDFFAAAFKDTADELGIVYTPVEVVDAQLHMVQRALQREFSQSLGEPGVHVLDGFAGTGTYLCRLIEDRTLISDEELPYKYAHDLHSNEIVPLAATIMDINIEQAYHARMGGAYVPFEGALLCDTFQLGEEDNVIDRGVFLENSERIEEQVRTPITVIVGNPPYRAGDKDNTGNQNAKYKTLDGRIAESYAAKSTARLKTALYDHYIRAFRWASDRIEDAGIVCFVSNGGWLTGEAGAGVRRCFCDEFNSIYVYNLRGNQRTQGEESRREGGKIFDSGSRATIAITLLVKNPDSKEHGVIRYRDIGDYLNRQQKLDILKGAIGGDPKWTVLNPDRHGDWLDQRDDSWYEFAPMGINKRKSPLGMFDIWSNGLKTQRDSWAWGYSRNQVKSDMVRLVNAINEVSLTLEDDHEIPRDETRFNWTRRIEDYVKRGIEIEYDQNAMTLGLYRPFCKQWVYYNWEMNEMTFQQPRLFPLAGGERAKGLSSNPNAASLTLTSTKEDRGGKGGEMTFQQMFPHCQNLIIDVGERGVLMSGILPDLELVHHGQCFPLYYYDEPAEAGEGSLFSSTELTCRDAITDEALAVFQEAYDDPSITKEDIFFYVYGILHSKEYRKRFANNLKKELPRIPLAADFRAFRDAGTQLAELHVNYEQVEPWPDLVEVGDSSNPGRTEKMAWGKVRNRETNKLEKDFTHLTVAENLTIEGIPERAQDYVVNGKSALAWLVDRYQVKTDKKSGIVNDPNLYAPDNPRYIVDLVESVVTVSMRTLDIVEALPPLNELPHPASWPVAWNMDSVK